MANNVRNQRTTHQKQNERRIRVIERWDQVTHGVSADKNKKEQERLALIRRTSANMSPRQVALDRLMAH